MVRKKQVKATEANKGTTDAGKTGETGSKHKNADASRSKRSKMKEEVAVNEGKPDDASKNVVAPLETSAAETNADDDSVSAEAVTKRGSTKHRKPTNQDLSEGSLLDDKTAGGKITENTDGDKGDGGGEEAVAPEAAKPLDEGKVNSPESGTIGVADAEKQQGVEEEDDDSSDDDGDGFRIVVGREREVVPAPSAPVKRFLRGTNTLVNIPSASNSSATTKPVSAAAGIASLVPSKGAPVSAARPSLKPGEYPPTAELQRAGGKSAFDVDIDGMEEQPWRHPGVDVADFFNYGFTEDSWRVYCEKQLRNRYDQGRPKPGGKIAGGVGGSHMRHGGGGLRRGGLEPPRERSMQHHNSGPGRPMFPPPQGHGAQDGWGPGPRPGPGQFGQGFGPGRGGGPPRPWFDGTSQMYPTGGPNMRSGQERDFHQQDRMQRDTNTRMGGGDLIADQRGGVGGGSLDPRMIGNNSGRELKRSRSPVRAPIGSDKMARPTH